MRKLSLFTLFIATACGSGIDDGIIGQGRENADTNLETVLMVVQASENDTHFRFSAPDYDTASSYEFYISKQNPRAEDEPGEIYIERIGVDELQGQSVEFDEQLGSVCLTIHSCLGGEEGKVVCLESENAVESLITSSLDAADWGGSDPDNVGGFVDWGGSDPNSVGGLVDWGGSDPSSVGGLVNAIDKLKDECRFGLSLINRE